MKRMIVLVAAVNLIMGGYLLNDAIVRLSTGQQLLIFDEYLGGFAKALPVLLGLSMIVASALLLVKKDTAMVFFSYINSFLVLLFYTPSVFYSGIEERYSPWLIGIQFALLITCTIFLFTTTGKGNLNPSERNRQALRGHKRSMHRFLDEEEDAEMVEKTRSSSTVVPGKTKRDNISL